MQKEIAMAKSSSSNSNYIPLEIAFEILAKVAVKPLMRFKSACKSWKNIIQDPEFVKLHLSNQRKRKGNSQVLLAASCSRGLLFIDSTAKNPVEEVGYDATDLNKEEGNEVVEFRSLMIVSDVADNDISMLDSCDGLLCFYSRESVHLCNPSARKFRTLPKTTPHVSRVYGNFHCSQRIGFGDDEVTGVYKVIRLFNKTKMINGIENLCMHCEIFTISGSSSSSSSQEQGSWRGIGETPYQISAAYSPICLHGTLYMLTDFMYHLNPSEILVSFDLHQETFQLLTHPGCFEDLTRERSQMMLFAMGDSLCLLDSQVDPQVNIWEMKSDRSVWTKKYGIDVRQLKVVGLFDLYAPIFFTSWHRKPNNLIMCLNGERFYDYDLQKKCFTDAEYKMPSTATFVHTLYFESLISVY